MMNPHDDRTINANVDEVLDALRKNLDEHKKVVAEAKAGYLKECSMKLHAAQALMEGRIQAMEAGMTPNMDPILFDVRSPEDHSREFTTVIKMLELHKNAHDSDPKNQGVDYQQGGVQAQVPKTPATIQLKAVDVQRYVLNEWDWMDRFLLSNAAYSATGRAMARSKGLV